LSISKPSESAGRFVVTVPDVNYNRFVPKELLPHAWVLTHNLFSVIRIDGRGSLSSTILRKLLGRNSTAIMRKLQGKLIEVERDYSAGYHCRFYRFVPRFTRFCCKTITDPVLVRAWFRNSVNRKKSIHRWLDQILADDELKFDSDGANGHLDRLTQQEFLALGKNCSMENYVAGVRQSIARAGNMQMLHLTQGLNLSTVDEFGHRYHTPLTSLPKIYRGYFRWSGEPLVNVDIRNSQPLFLCLAFVNAGGEIKDDWKRYKDLCERGCLYESLNWSNIDRDEFKERFFEEVLFSKPETVLYKTFTQKFFAEFESVFRFIFELKNPRPSRQLKGKDREKPHRLLAKHLQRAESQFMFEQVIPSLMAQGIRPVIPIHDSVLTTANHASAVKSAVRAGFKRVKFKCEVRVEPTIGEQ
jgi:hypothetical protein